MLPGPAQDVRCFGEDVCFFGGYFEVGLMEFLENSRIGCGDFFMCLATDEYIISDFATFSLLQFFF